MFNQAEKQKRELTDKYVVVDATVPELMRFGGHVGQVKTVNMNGRALVQFDAWNNIGWYDIEVDYLKVVPKPEGVAAEKKPESKPASPSKEGSKPAAAAGEKKLSPLEMARLQGAVKRPAAEPAGEKAAAVAQPPGAGAAKKSTADILAAARAAKAAPPAAAEQSPAPAASGKLSTAEILAAARAKQAAAAPAATIVATIAAQPAAPGKAPVEQPQSAAPSAATVVKPKGASAPALPSGQRPSLSEILAWCREHDSK
jgi:hypothetical protein